jgi:hypothetical protein
LQARFDLTARFDEALVFVLFFNEAVPYKSQGLRFPVGKVVVLLSGLSRLLDRFVQRLGIGRSTCTWDEKGDGDFYDFQRLYMLGGNLPMAALIGIWKRKRLAMRMASLSSDVFKNSDTHSKHNLFPDATTTSERVQGVSTSSLNEDLRTEAY